MALFVMLSQPVTLEDLGLTSINELREAAEEFGCNIINLPYSPYFLFTSDTETALRSLGHIHDSYTGVIVEVSKIHM